MSLPATRQQNVFHFLQNSNMLWIHVVIENMNCTMCQQTAIFRTLKRASAQHKQAYVAAGALSVARMA
jgi:hypothetical protein